MKLTATNIGTIQLPADKAEIIVCDDAIPGFGIRIRKGGSRNCIFTYRIAGTNRRMSLGAVMPEAFATAKNKDDSARVSTMSPRPLRTCSD